MQTKKENIERILLVVAREQFMKNGVRKTSMQTIARLSGVAVGNIYNYFKSKDDLFKAIMRPLLVAMEDYNKHNLDEVYISLDVFKEEKFFERMKKQVEALILPYKDEMRLLITQSQGTSLEHFLRHFKETQKIDGMKYIERMKNHFPELSKEVSPLFLNIISDLWMSVIKQIVLNPMISEAEIDLLLNNFITYGMGGWKSLLRA
ncbi:MAG: TetR/AcrR family transcriptional regulator [Prevotella sp.]|nr:TetR/AcrR family transcriptional regulator [Prevotellaceae bacterium]MDY3935251.1 TetR/AcrR family transcriptional regulator [Prevotella sp.]